MSDVTAFDPNVKATTIEAQTTGKLHKYVCVCKIYPLHKILVNEISVLNYAFEVITTRKIHRQQRTTIKHLSIKKKIKKKLITFFPDCKL